MTPAPAGPGFWLPAASLWWREVKRFYRQPSRVIGGLGSPLLFWILIGSGVGRSFRPPGAEGLPYLAWFLPGTVVLVVLFTAIFSTISIIEDRREGFLQGVLASPAPRGSVVFGKVLGAATLSFLQGAALLVAARLGGVAFLAPRWVLAAALLAATSFALACLGFLIAWRMESVQGFHSIMNLGLIPMWILSGALFPAEGASPWVQAVMRLNPLSYAVGGIQMSLFYDPDWMLAGAVILSCLAGTALFGAVLFAAAWLLAARGERVR